MKNRNLAFLAGITFLLAGSAAGIAACSSDPDPAGGGGDVAPQKDGGRDGSLGDGTGGDAGGGGGGGSDAGSGDAGPDCGDPERAPRLRPSADAGIFCPFQADGAPPSTCAIGEHCCTYPQNAGRSSACQTAPGCATADAGEVEFQCGEDSDCLASGATCCMVGEPVLNTECPGRNYARGVKGTFCRTGGGCNAGEVRICSKAAGDDAGADAGECPTGKSCVPFATKTIYLGACL